MLRSIHSKSSARLRANERLHPTSAVGRPAVAELPLALAGEPQSVGRAEIALAQLHQV